jgi:hypothetical protein
VASVKTVEPTEARKEAERPAAHSVTARTAVCDVVEVTKVVVA